MPSVLIGVRREYTPEQEDTLMAAVHAVLREAFLILPGDRDIRFNSHAPHRYSCPVQACAEAVVVGDWGVDIIAPPCCQGVGLEG